MADGYVPETLMHPLQELEAEYFRAQQDPEFQRELQYYLHEFCGRPTPLYFAERLTRELGGAKIYLKREDLLHTGAHKINNAIGQILLARRMGKTRIIAETGAGQHGVATATVAAMFGLKCVIYMGAVDCERQALNVYRMKMLGAEVVSVTAGQKTLKEAVNEAMRDWVTNVRTRITFSAPLTARIRIPSWCAISSASSAMKRAAQILEQEQRLPDLLLACVGGGSNAIGLFYPFLDDASREDGRRRSRRRRHHARPARRAVPGRLARRVARAHAPIFCRTSSARSNSRTASAPDWTTPPSAPNTPGLRDDNRVEYTYATDDKALDAFMKLARLEGIIPALETAHAIAEVIVRAPKMAQGQAHHRQPLRPRRQRRVRRWPTRSDCRCQSNHVKSAYENSCTASFQR